MNFIAVILATLGGAVLGAVIFGSPLGRKGRVKEIARRMVEEDLTLRQIKQRQAARKRRPVTSEEIDEIQKATRHYVTDHLSDSGLADYVNGILRGDSE